MVEVWVYSEVKWLLSTSFHRLHWNTAKSRWIVFRYIHRTHQRNVTVGVDVLFIHFRASHNCQKIKLVWYLRWNTDHLIYPIIMSFSSLSLGCIIYCYRNFFVIWRVLDEVPLLRNYILHFYHRARWTIKMLDIPTDTYVSLTYLFTNFPVF